MLLPETGELVLCELGIVVVLLEWTRIKFVSNIHNPWNGPAFEQTKRGMAPLNTPIFTPQAVSRRASAMKPSGFHPLLRWDLLLWARYPDLFASPVHFIAVAKAFLPSTFIFTFLTNLLLWAANHHIVEFWKKKSHLIACNKHKSWTACHLSFMVPLSANRVILLLFYTLVAKYVNPHFLCVLVYPYHIIIICVWKIERPRLNNSRGIALMFDHVGSTFTSVLCDLQHNPLQWLSFILLAYLMNTALYPGKLLIENTFPHVIYTYAIVLLLLYCCSRYNCTTLPKPIWQTEDRNAYESFSSYLSALYMRNSFHVRLMKAYWPTECTLMKHP